MQIIPHNIYIIKTYSDNYNSNNQGPFSSRQLNNRGFPFGVLKMAGEQSLLVLIWQWDMVLL